MVGIVNNQCFYIIKNGFGFFKRNAMLFWFIAFFFSSHSKKYIPYIYYNY